MKNGYRMPFIIYISFLLIISCEDFVDLAPPNYKMVTETVFENEETAIAAITGIYNELFSSASFANGHTSSVTVLAGMSSDIFETTSVTDNRYGPFQQNQISPRESPDASANYELWSSAYNIIYMTNSIVEGVTNSTILSEETRNRVEGQARFIRAFTYFYLVNLYGKVPLILTTAYGKNALATRDPEVKVFEQVSTDLDLAMSLLEDAKEYKDLERTNVTYFVAMALRARIYLYEQNWMKAEELSSKVIDQTSIYQIVGDLDQ